MWGCSSWKTQNFMSWFSPADTLRYFSAADIIVYNSAFPSTPSYAHYDSISNNRDVLPCYKKLFGSPIFFGWIFHQYRDTIHGPGSASMVSSHFYGHHITGGQICLNIRMLLLYQFLFLLLIGGMQYTKYPSTNRGSFLAFNDRTLDVQVTSDRPITP